MTSLAPGAGSTVSSVSDSRTRCPRFDTYSSHILSFLFPLIQEGQLSVTGESMCIKCWITNRLGGLNLPRKSVVRLTDRPCMTLPVYTMDLKQQHNNNNKRSLAIFSMTSKVVTIYRKNSKYWDMYV